MTSKRTVVVGLLGTRLDAGAGAARWERWRPSVALCQHEHLLVDRFELLYEERFEALARAVAADIRAVSPETEVRCTPIAFDDAWDFERVYAALHDFCRGYPFDPEREDYLVHITTGTHVAQICLFLLTESRHLPGRLLQTSPPRAVRDPDKARGGAGHVPERPGSFEIIDLDLSRYDRLASRFRQEQRDGLSFLKAGIETKSPAYNRLIERVEQAAVLSRAPILLTGPTGAGKSQLARRIHELKKARRQIAGDLVEVNCATIRGDGAMSALFGHVKGAFTGALEARPGLLRKAHGGMLFLDEIGELGLDEQAMLLRALEDKVFLPLGADREVKSDFQLVAGTNRDLWDGARRGAFREDLLARIDLWTFALPGLRDRLEDLEPNLDYELDQAARLLGTRVTLRADARARFLRFARAPEASWAGNFRDLNAAVTRMATLAPGGRIGLPEVEEEIGRLEASWRRLAGVPGAFRPAVAPAAAAPPEAASPEADAVEAVLGAARAADLDRFDRAQLGEVLRVCRGARSLSEAGRELFAASRAKKTTVNDADRLRKYLARFGIGWSDLAD